MLLVITSATPYGLAKFGANPSTGGFWVNGWVITKIYLFIYLLIPFYELTYRSDPSTAFHAWWLKKRGIAQGLPFGEFRWYCSPFWGWNTPTPNFWGVNRRFQAKRAKYRKFHIIETTALISTNFCTKIETTNCSSPVVPISHPTNPIWRTAAIFKKTYNRHTSATVWRILLKFGMVTHIGPLQRSVR